MKKHAQDETRLREDFHRLHRSTWNLTGWVQLSNPLDSEGQSSQKIQGTIALQARVAMSQVGLTSRVSFTGYGLLYTEEGRRIFHIINSIKAKLTNPGSIIKFSLRYIWRSGNQLKAAKTLSFTWYSNFGSTNLWNIVTPTASTPNSHNSSPAALSWHHQKR